MPQGNLFPQPTATRLLSSDPRKWVVVHNDVVLARVDWEITMIRLFHLFVSLIGKDDESFGMMRIRVQDLLDFAQISRNDIHEAVADAAQRLVREPFEFRTPDHSYEGTPIFAMCRYVRGSGIVQAKFNEHAKPYLLRLSRCFTRYKLEYVMRLSTPYAVRFYQIAKMIERDKETRQQKMEVGIFRELFLITDKYERYSDVVRRIIRPSVEEVNQKTDASLRCWTERQGGTKYGKPLNLIWKVQPAKPSGNEPRKAGRAGLDLMPRGASSVCSGEARSEAQGKTAFDRWFENLSSDEQDELLKCASALVEAAGTPPDARRFSALVKMKMTEMTKEDRLAGESHSGA
jgi:hypothetical protein